MVKIGYTMMCEQRSPKDLVNDVVLAEQAGFDFSVISDHYHPWVEAQGHAGFAWSILGAAAQATEKIGLMTYVTCPLIRYHPALVAQMAATVSLLSEGRFRLGLGSGEALNEHVVGQEYPAIDIRHEMLEEAVEIIRELFGGEYVTYRGVYFDVEGAKLFDCPPTPPEIGIAAGGPQACTIAGQLGDILITTEPKADFVQGFVAAGGEGKPVVGQTSVCWGSDEAACRTLAHEQFAWSLGGWKIQSELPNCVNFEAYTRVVSEDQVAEAVPCGPDTNKIAETVKKFADAGFTELALNQVGPDQAAFCDYFARELGPALRKI
jgi:G6PDH family F420-dependent oxidoreductase